MHCLQQPVKSATVEVCQCLIDAGADPVLGDPFRVFCPSYTHTHTHTHTHTRMPHSYPNPPTAQRLRFFGLAQEGIEVIRLLKQHGVEVDGPGTRPSSLTTIS
jgi:hypothetical protein